MNDKIDTSIGKPWVPGPDYEEKPTTNVERQRSSTEGVEQLRELEAEVERLRELMT